MNPIWREHFEALKRSNLLDVQRLRAQPNDYPRALRWLSEAWEIAETNTPSGDPTGYAEEHLRYLENVRIALARADLSP